MSDDHSWFMRQTCTDFIIMNFDEAYVFAFKNVGLDRNRYDTGGIYILEDKDKKLMPITNLTVTYQNWAYSPTALRFIPLSYEVVAETDKGVLKALMEPVMPPAWYHHRRMEQFKQNHINGWQFTYWTGETKVKGTFTYKNGRELKLTNGVGRNEPQRVSWSRVLERLLWTIKIFLTS